MACTHIARQAAEHISHTLVTQYKLCSHIEDMDVVISYLPFFHCSRARS